MDVGCGRQTGREDLQSGQRDVQGMGAGRNNRGKNKHYNKQSAQLHEANFANPDSDSNCRISCSSGTRSLWTSRILMSLFFVVINKPVFELTFNDAAKVLQQIKRSIDC